MPLRIAAETASSSEHIASLFAQFGILSRPKANPKPFLRSYTMQAIAFVAMRRTSGQQSQPSRECGEIDA
jgi:hypothetical protein